MRITKKQVKHKIDVINGILGYDDPQWNTIGAIRLQGQYGGYAIHKVMSIHGGIAVLLGTSTLRECAAFLSGMNTGLDLKAGI